MATSGRLSDALVTTDDVSLALELRQADVNRSGLVQLCRFGPAYELQSSRLPTGSTAKQSRHRISRSQVALPPSMALPIPSAEDIIRSHSEVKSSRTYVTASDLAVRQYWAACTVGFAYRLDTARLRSATQDLVDLLYPVLTSRYRSSALYSLCL